MKESIYEVVVAPRVENQMKKIPKEIRDKILGRLDKLSHDPRPENTTPLSGADKGLYRIRQGDYRIVYSIQDKKLLVLIVRVAHRKEVYKKKHSN